MLFIFSMDATHFPKLAHGKKDFEQGCHCLLKLETLGSYLVKKPTVLTLILQSFAQFIIKDKNTIDVARLAMNIRLPLKINNYNRMYQYLLTYSLYILDDCRSPYFRRHLDTRLLRKGILKIVKEKVVD